MQSPTDYPGASLGLPETGRGSLASWRARLAALAIDWAASMIVAVGLFGTGVLREQGWRAWTIMGVFFVQKTLLTWLRGGSFGQLLARISVVRLDGQPLGLGLAAARTAMICLVLPALVLGPDRRGLDDIVLSTVVLTRR